MDKIRRSWFSSRNTLRNSATVLTQTFLKFQSLSAITTFGIWIAFSEIRRRTYALLESPCPSDSDCRFAERPALCTRRGLPQYRARARLPVWVLRLAAVQLRTIRVLRARVVQQRRVHRSRPLVPLLPRLPQPR